MTNSADAKAAANSIFVTGLRNAHAMEAQAQELLERQIERLDDYPELKTRMQQHLSETKDQQGRLERILGAMNEQTSTLKDTALAFVGNLAAAGHMAASDEVLKNSFASFGFENYEVAAYKSLMELAQFAGATDAVSLLRQSCNEEQSMADFLSNRIQGVTRQYVSRVTGAAPIAASGANENVAR